MPESTTGNQNLPPDARAQVPAALGGDQQSHATGDTPAREIGGPRGPEPTRYGDWERNGRCTDF